MNTDAIELKPVAVDQSDGGETPVKRRWTAGNLFGLLFVTAIFGALNWPFQYQPVWVATAIDAQWYDFGLGRDDLQLSYPVQAGWPQRYLIRHSFDDAMPHTYWSTTNLLIDLFVALAVLAGVFWHSWPRSDSNRSSKRSISLFDLLILIALIAAGMSYHQLQVRRTEQDRLIAGQLQSSGHATRESFAPQLLHRWLPARLYENWARITAVDLDQPSTDQVQLACQLPYLRSLRLGGRDYDISQLRRLPAMRYLQDLRVSGRELDPQTVLSIAACPLVRQLNVAHSNCGAGAVKQFSAMPRLRRVMAFGSAIPDETWDKSELKHSLRDLVLARPATGQPGSIQLSNWPKLESLRFRSLDGQLNPNAYSIAISDMPELKDIQVDVFQMVDLDLQRLPKLETLKPEFAAIGSRTAEDQRVPQNLWTRKMVLNDLPAFEVLWFYPADFQSLELTDCDSITQIIASTRDYPGGANRQFNYELNVKNQQSVIDHLGNLEGHSTFSFWGFRVDQLDLSPLTKSTSIDFLDLSHSVLGKDSLKQIQSLPLRTIKVGNAKLPRSFINELMGRFPDLESLTLDSSIEAVRIEDKPKLKTLSFDQHKKSNLTALRLVNTPDLESPIVINPLGNYVHVEQAPLMTGLAVLTPHPTIAISGVQGLQWFIGGGSSMNNEVVNEVLQAKGLTHLTLAYPVAETAAFETLTQLTHLVELKTPGAPLSDNLIQQWEIPQSLLKLDFRDCGLSIASTSKLIRRGGWQELWIGGNEIDPNDLTQLGVRSPLTSLGLAGTTMDVQTINNLGSMPDLIRLDLSATAVQSGGLAALIKLAPGLRELDLTDATVDWSEFNTLTKANPALKFKLGPSDATVGLVTALFNDDRLIRDKSAIEVWFEPEPPQLLGYDATGNAVYAPESADKGPPQFERPDWPPDFFRPDQADEIFPLTSGATSDPGSLKEQDDDDQ